MEYKVFFTGKDGHAFPALLWEREDELDVYTCARHVLGLVDGLFSEVTVMDAEQDKVIFRMWT